MLDANRLITSAAVFIFCNRVKEMKGVYVVKKRKVYVQFDQEWIQIWPEYKTDASFERWRVKLALQYMWIALDLYDFHVIYVSHGEVRLNACNEGTAAFEYTLGRVAR
ncbi:hypothetical protein G6F46_001683 [Rhizopus delemar]|uniref:Uncharacterized protein n=3 Tax=Rhizopus TaxID=4842 RepID=I1C6V0_RHIO9|nr:hypothetical protein RO3G_08890 [Rhizopus delemar RA 99-880]KAG1466161.1 hypothetical protein G6F55_000671 [Rhizopus delemar]KAG1547554.1 hypothetical protein G6F51_004201 [Rhizopus arrhizus]KAG1488163.1 hypothetical protein G6F54_012223 [Rhizopus delemar]KAG1514489.1 hypothetical protein G6F53_003639 [Rhizopus delemar]|eukprot:EIE84180.1 hypothetical protein RO3G_08890 [Rhizopus delemar RA 99-880]